MAPTAPLPSTPPTATPIKQSAVPAKARQLMLQVHYEGKAIVSSGTREKAEYDVARLHAHGLWATMRQDG